MEMTFEFIPSAAGRRMCTGVAFGITTVEYYLANMLFHFDRKLPNGMQVNEVDTTESFGGTVEMKEKLILVLHPYERS